MDAKIKSGACFLNYDETVEACQKCVVAYQCNKVKQDRIKKKEKAEGKKANKTPQDFHDALVKEIGKYFHTTQVEKFGESGVEHKFVTEDNKTRCIIKTLLPSMKMKILANEWQMVEPLKSNGELDRIICNIKRTLALEDN